MNFGTLEESRKYLTNILPDIEPKCDHLRWSANCPKCAEKAFNYAAETSKRLDGKLSASVEKRFWSRVKKMDQCWLWTGSLLGGYGRMNVAGATLIVSRVSWQINYGPIPKGMVVMHICDNPGCVRPDHLKLGTQRDNILDMDKKGRRKARKLSDEEVAEMRRLKSAGVPQRLLAEKFSVSQSFVSFVVRQKILNGKVYSECSSSLNL